MRQTRIIVFILCITMIPVMLVGCSAKTPITAADFTNTMRTEKFIVVDVTAKTETNGLATAVIVAASEDGGYQIEFWELTDSEIGLGVFNNNIKIISEEHSIKTMSSKINSGNYNYYAFTAEENFHMVARIDNTMLYCEADKAYKDDIVRFAKQLGYK